MVLDFHSQAIDVPLVGYAGKGQFEHLSHETAGPQDIYAVAEAGLEVVAQAQKPVKELDASPKLWKVATMIRIEEVI